MKTLKIGVILLALMLAAMAMVPMVSAADTVNAASSEEMKIAPVDVGKIQLPHLQFDNSQKKVTVIGELSPEQNTQSEQVAAMVATSKSPTVSSIPYGSIIYHSNDGVTTVFDSSGKQMFAADDNEAKILPTPNGFKRATYVSEVPSESHIIARDHITYVFNKGVLILTIINENVTQNILNEKVLNQKPDVTALAMSNFNGWIEYAYDNLPRVRQFDAYWMVPSSPPSSESAEPVFLFNGIRTPGETAIVQPVLEWNQPSTGRYWTGSSWALKDGMQTFKSTRINANTGDTIKGRLYWYSATGEWYIQIYDITTGQYRSLYSNYVPDSNFQVDVTLEGWGIDDNTDVPGDTTFYGMVYKYNGNTVPVVLKRYTSPSAPLTQLNVEFLSNPSTVKLHTAN